MKISLDRAVTEAVSKCRQIAHKMPLVEKVGKSILRSKEAWAGSRFLKHPYVQLERGFVFIHVPKAAGTSLNQALGLNAPLTSHLHRRARDVVPFLKGIAPNIKSISFVRNPYDRFVSLYNFARVEESLYCSTSHPESAPCGKHPDHDTLLDKSMEQCAELLIGGKLSGGGWNPQVEWLVDKEGKDGILIVDFIGRVESLGADLERLQKTYGIAVQPVPWLNKSTGDQKIVPQWTARARDLVRLYYKRDFEMLGYDE